MAEIQLTLYATDSPIMNQTDKKFPKAMKAVTRFAWRIFHKSVWTAMERPIYTKHELMTEDRTR